jgi:uncharacterized protein (DUF1501 family)
MLSRRHLLGACAAGAVCASLPRPRLARADTGAGTVAAKNLVIVLATGGWDPTYALDPKPGSTATDAASGTIKKYGDLAVCVDPARPSVTSFFDAYAGISAAVNGVQMQSFVHPDCWKRILTGTASDANPDLGAITAYELGRDLPVPYLVLGHTAFTGPLASIAARVGSTNQILALLDPTAAYAVNGAAGFALDGAEDTAIARFVDARVARERATRGARGYNRARIDDFVNSLDRGTKLKGYASGFGQRGLAATLTDQATLAANALESGLCRAVHIEYSGWDTHSNNGTQAELHDTLFAGLSALAADLSQRSGRSTGKTLLDETVVAVISEMGRTPKLNAAKGKDHWPVTSALVFGAGVRGGRSYGGSTDGLQAQSVDFATGDVDAGGKQIQSGNLVTGILKLVGLQDSVYLPDAEPFDALIA